MKRNDYWVYIMASFSRVLYTGITNNLERRVAEHKSGLIDGFSKKYKTQRLVYCEYFSQIQQAIDREKQIKKWGRPKKINLIKTMNPEMGFLNDIIEPF